MPEHVTERSICVASAAFLLFGCQALTGLSDLDPDGKHARDAGTVAVLEAGQSESADPGRSDDAALVATDAGSVFPEGMSKPPTSGQAGSDTPPPRDAGHDDHDDHDEPDDDAGVPDMQGAAGSVAPPPPSQPCNPLGSQQEDDQFDACDTGQYCQAAHLDDGWHNDCTLGSRNPQGTASASCMTYADCAEGHFCSTKNWCLSYCHVALHDCPAQQECLGLSDQLVVAGAEIGYCTCPGANPSQGFCSPLSQCGCGAGQKCELIDARAACIPVGTGWIGAACGSSSDCTSDTNCNAGTCHLRCDPTQSDPRCAPGKCDLAGVCRGGFTGSCMNYTFNSPMLMADCATRDGRSWTPTSIDLSQGIANDNGLLTVRPDGGFSSSCSDVVVALNATRAILTANCTMADGMTVVPARVELGEVLANIDGQLKLN